jgi:hypothetical protein
MGFLRKFFGRDSSDAGSPSTSAARQDEELEQGVSYKDLMRQLYSAGQQTRHDSAMLLSALGHRAAIRPLIRTYLTYGDQSVLDALAAFGPKVTMVAARESRDMSLSPTQRARLMDVLGATGDPGAVTLVLPKADDEDTRVHLAACGALTRLGDPRGIDRLADDLMRLDSDLRAGALTVLQDLDRPEADAAIEDYIQRYLSAGGAVPSDVQVSIPLLIDRRTDLVGLTGDHVRRSRADLTVITGPAMDSVSEEQRGELQAGMPRHVVRFVTPRHSPEEQRALLDECRGLASAGTAARVVLVGHLPSPEGPQPLPHFLLRVANRDYTVRIVLIGPKRFAPVMEWWRYVSDRAEVQTEMEVVLTNLVFGGGDLTTEELAIYDLAGECRRHEFARAFLAQL